MNLITSIKTYARLGLVNLVRVAAYKLLIKSRYHPVQRLSCKGAQPPFFRFSEHVCNWIEPNRSWDYNMWWFGWYRTPLTDGAPDWFVNPFSNATQPGNSTDWWLIPDFESGDIKGQWELSRFDWVVAWATRAACGDIAALKRLNSWLADWSEKNLPYKGPNWKCGQEASIRVMHLAAAVYLLRQHKSPEQGLTDLVRTHLKRIFPTMSYALGQQNNHGTSEAAALFIGGSLLLGIDQQASTWISKGRHWLEDRANKLIAVDGSFSQSSVTYHRMMLDSYSLVEIWRRVTNQPPFSSSLYKRLVAATHWLEVMTIAETGDAPNLGANDGVRLLPLADHDYRDFRPSVQLAAALFQGRDAFGPGPWNLQLEWLNVSQGSKGAWPSSETFDNGGFHLMRKGKAFAMLRYPRRRFRPSQADALHLDLWLNGRNILRDAGSYSYNHKDSSWFRGTAAHNTVQFDYRDQMPQLGRFLFGEWLDAEDVLHAKIEEQSIHAAAAYKDYKGARHKRHVTLSSREMLCVDLISGKFETACLRWRLSPGNWILRQNTLRCENISILVESDMEPSDLLLTQCSESRYYQHRQRIPVLEVRLNCPSKIITKVRF